MESKEMESLEVYKYYRLNDNFIDNLSNRRIYAPSREELNDPFDILSFVKVDGRKTSYRTIINALKTIYPGIFENLKETNDNLHQIVKSNNINLVNVLREYNLNIDPNEYFKYLAGKMKVVSFAQSKYSKLMWAHYADAFRGILIKYQIYPSEEAFENFIRVKYEKKNQELENLKDVIEYIFGYKLEEWKYEEEVRVVIDRDNANDFFTNHELLEVYLGSNFEKNSPEMIKKFKSALLKYQNINFYKSILDFENYNLEFVKINLESISVQGYESK